MKDRPDVLQNMLPGLFMADVYLTMAGYPYQEVTDTTKAWCVDGLWTMTAYPVNTPSAKDLLAESQNTT